MVRGNWKSELDCLLKPKSIAVIGATEKVGPGRNTMYNLLNMGFQGKLYPINPNRDSVFDVKCYKGLIELPERPDLVVVSLPAARVAEALKECASMGIPAAMVYTSGFAEVNDDGRAMQDEITAICENASIRLCGPNCLGHLNVNGRTGAYSASLPVNMIPGKVAVVSQSGSMAIAMLQAFKGLGMSHIISYGNQAVLELPDYLDYLSDDPDTHVITTFIEGVKDGRRFIESAKECRRKGKAIIALKVGKSELGQKAVSAHTAAMAGSDAVFTEALREAGVFQVGDIDEMLQTATLLVRSVRMPSKGVALIAISGGQIGMIADIAKGLEFPAFCEETVQKLKPLIPPYLNIRNPLDVAGVGSDNYEDYANVLRCCASDPSIGLMLVSQDAPSGVGPSTIDHYGKIARAVTEVFHENKNKNGTPLVMFSNHSTPYCPEIVQTMLDSGVPYLQGTRESLAAVSHFVNYSGGVRAKTSGIQTEYPFTWGEIEKKFEELRGGKKFLGEMESKEMLSMLGINVAKQVLCRDERELLSSGLSLGYPLVMKIESPDIAHKTEAKGVALGIDSEAKLTEAYAVMMKAVKEHSPNSRIDGVTLQKMAPNGIDLIIGTHKDPQFGPVMVFGLGGIYVEIFNDSSLGLIPVNHDKALEMIKMSKSYSILKGARGQASMDIEALVDIMTRISGFAQKFSEQISAIDINPVRISSSGVMVLDALILVL